MAANTFSVPSIFKALMEDLSMCVSCFYKRELQA